MITKITDELVKSYDPEGHVCMINGQGEPVSKELIPEFERLHAEYVAKMQDEYNQYIEKLTATCKWFDVELKYPNSDIETIRHHNGTGIVPDLSEILVDLCDDAATYMYHHGMPEDESLVEFRTVLPDGTASEWKKLKEKKASSPKIGN